MQQQRQQQFSQARLKEMYSASIARYEEENDYLFKQVTSVNQQNIELHEKLNQAFTQRSQLRQDLCQEKLNSAKEINNSRKEIKSLQEAIEELKLLVQEKDDSLQEAICTIEELNRKNLSLVNENNFLKHDSESEISKEMNNQQKQETSDNCIRGRTQSIDSGVSSSCISLFDEIEELQKIGMVRCSTKRQLVSETVLEKPSLFTKSIGERIQFSSGRLNIGGPRIEIGWLDFCG